MLVLCPEQFEIQKFRYSSPMSHYVEPSIRPLDEEGLGDLDSSRKLVLVSFGTQSIRYKGMLKQIGTVSELARRLPLVQFVLSTGIAQRYILGDSLAAPTNLFVCEKVPQRKLLERTCVFRGAVFEAKGGIP